MSAASLGGQIVPRRFAIALQALVLLARTDEVSPSASMACQLKSHATFLRRVMIPLVQAGIVAAREGRDGGYLLGRPAERITLAEVYAAVKSECTGEGSETGGQCGEGGPLNTALEEIMEDVEEQVIGALNRYTIADLVQRAKAPA